MLRRRECFSRFQNGHNDPRSRCQNIAISMLELKGFASPYRVQSTKILPGPDLFMSVTSIEQVCRRKQSRRPSSTGVVQGMPSMPSYLFSLFILVGRPRLPGFVVATQLTFSLHLVFVPFDLLLATCSLLSSSPSPSARPPRC